jgi:endonuclease G
VVTGPVLRKRESTKIGENKVSVPKAYYKALLDLKHPEQKAVGFLIPNEKQDKPLGDFDMSIDDLEALVGIDFFPELPDELETKIASEFNASRWMYDEERYQTRLSQWNMGYGSAEY